ncbi:Hypothetical predicted protein [Paramuricea clavata]|uniref:Uncharacterized protein n=1 Tax=Paramuricea clavata TaxID=317549 RepID=A0A6S7K662_PARCT|nr:Hypothetical predicted protein [Paramuricea clavata]
MTVPVVMLHKNGPHGVTALRKTGTHYDKRRAYTEQKMAILWSWTQNNERYRLQQETNGHMEQLTDNGNIVVLDTEGPTQNNERYRLRQETNGHRGRPTENGNIVVLDTEGATQNNERYRDVEARSRHQDLSHPSAHRPRDPQTSKPQENQREPPLPVLDDRALRSFQLPSQEAFLQKPSTPLGNPPREEPRHGPWCNICGKNMQV